MTTTVKTEIWVGWLAGLLVSAVCFTAVVITFAYANFETKEHAREVEQRYLNTIESINRRMDAMRFPPDPGPARYPSNR